MTITELIYRKQMIEQSLISFTTTRDNKHFVLALCNADRSFLHYVVRDYRGGVSITTRIERLRSGSTKY